MGTVGAVTASRLRWGGLPEIATAIVGLRVLPGFDFLPVPMFAG